MKLKELLSIMSHIASLPKEELTPLLEFDVVMRKCVTLPSNDFEFVDTNVAGLYMDDNCKELYISDKKTMSIVEERNAEGA